MKRILTLFLLLTISTAGFNSTFAADSFIDLIKSYENKKLYFWIDSGTGVFHLTGIVQKVTDSYIVVKDTRNTYFIKIEKITYVATKR